jgi:hypothetical protein
MAISGRVSSSVGRATEVGASLRALTISGEPRPTSGAFALAVDVSLNLIDLEGLLERLAQHP